MQTNGSFSLDPKMGPEMMGHHLRLPHSRPTLFLGPEWTLGPYRRWSLSHAESMVSLTEQNCLLPLKSISRRQNPSPLPPAVDYGSKAKWAANHTWSFRVLPQYDPGSVT